MSNYTQPDFRNPNIAGVSVQVEGKSNPLAPGPAPLTHYTDPTTSKDVPAGYQTPSGK